MGFSRQECWSGVPLPSPLRWTSGHLRPVAPEEDQRAPGGPPAVLHGGGWAHRLCRRTPEPVCPTGVCLDGAFRPLHSLVVGNPTMCRLAPHSYKDYFHSSSFQISMALPCLSFPAEGEFLILQKKFRPSYGDSFNFPTPNLHGPAHELALTCAFLDMWQHAWPCTR